MKFSIDAKNAEYDCTRRIITSVIGLTPEELPDEYKYKKKMSLFVNKNKLYKRFHVLGRGESHKILEVGDDVSMYSLEDTKSLIREQNKILEQIKSEAKEIKPIIMNWKFVSFTDGYAITCILGMSSEKMIEHKLVTKDNYGYLFVEHGMLHLKLNGKNYDTLVDMGEVVSRYRLLLLRNSIDIQNNKLFHQTKEGKCHISMES